MMAQCSGKHGRGESVIAKKLLAAAGRLLYRILLIF